MDNRQLISKADLALSDLAENGGYLQPEQAKRFIKLLIKNAVLMPMVTVVPMKSHKKQISKIKMEGRVLRAGNPGTALPAADRARPVTSEVELDAKLFKGQVNLEDSVLEDSIEGNRLKETVLQLMAEQVSVDIEEVQISGDTESPDPFLAQFDGILKSATSHVVNAGGARLSREVCRDTIKALPQQYLRRRQALKFLTSINAEFDYRDSLADRGTALGDRATTDNARVPAFGVEIVPIPMFPEDLGVGSNTTNMLLLDPKNINLGFWREIQFEWDRDIEVGVTKIVVTMRMDQKYQHEDAVVKTTNILAD